MNTYCIILNWNNYQDTIDCLESVLKHSPKNLKIIVCDNLSSNKSFDEIRSFISNKANNTGLQYQILDKVTEHPLEDVNIYLVQTGANLGYAGGNNVGIRLALRDPNLKAVWLLNNDTVIDNLTLLKLEQCAEHQGNSTIVGSVLVNFSGDDIVQTAGTHLVKILGLPRKLLKGHRASELTGNIAVDSASGASMYIPKYVLNALGVLDERYFLYWEETDYCFQLQRKLNKKPLCALESKVKHKEGAKAGRRSRQQVTLDSINLIRFYKRFYPMYLPTVLMLRPLIDIISSIKNKEFKPFWLWLPVFSYLKALQMNPTESTKKYL